MTEVAKNTDALADLVLRFSSALLDKLRAAEAKYGHNDAWQRDDWRDDLAAHLVRHVDKGDPRDVAAYCAFAWHHGWSVTPTSTQSEDDVERVARAMWQAVVDDAKLGGSPPTWDGTCEATREKWRLMARAALAAISTQSDVERLREALRLCYVELSYCSKQLAAHGQTGSKGDSVSRALAAGKAALSSQTTPPVERKLGK